MTLLYEKADRLTILTRKPQFPTHSGTDMVMKKTSLSGCAQLLPLKLARAAPAATQRSSAASAPPHATQRSYQQDPSNFGRPTARSTNTPPSATASSSSPERQEYQDSSGSPDTHSDRSAISGCKDIFCEHFELVEGKMSCPGCGARGTLRPTADDGLVCTGPTCTTCLPAVAGGPPH